MNLQELRTNLSAIDRQLVELIAARQQIVADIGKSKRTTGTGTRDYAREKDVLDAGRAQAKNWVSIPISSRICCNFLFVLRWKARNGIGS